MDNLMQWTVESALLHADKANKRSFIVIVILLIALLGTNAGWIYYESQWTVVDTTQQEVLQKTDSGDISFVGGNMNGIDTESNDNAYTE